MTDSSLWLRRTGAALFAVGTLAGCASTTSGHPGGSTAAPTTPAPTGTGIPAGFPTDVHSLAATVNKALQSTTSAHLVLTFDEHVSTIRVNMAGEGDETVQDGKAKDMQMILTVANVGTERLVTVDGKSYVLLPSTQRTSGKPWALVTPNSSNYYVRILAQSMSATAAFAGTDAAKTFLSASDRLTKDGTTQLDDGTQVARYSLDVLTDRLPNSNSSKRVLRAAGVTHVPTELSIDSTGHIRQLQQNLSLAVNGIKVTTQTKIEMSDYNAPVSISAPPPDQVALH